MRIGVDVGGTNTDAVLMDGDRVIAISKIPTTRDIGAGIEAALARVLLDSSTDPRRIRCVMIGTTQFINAFVQARDLTPVGVVRLGAPATLSLPPFTAWPEVLRNVVDGGHYILPGGFEIDGHPISRFDARAVADAARDLRNRGIFSIAISCVSSPANPRMEDEAQDIVRNEIPEAFITLSHEIGRLGLLERENATIINCSLCKLAVRVIPAFENALSKLGIHAPLYISQNDGTLKRAADVISYPVLTFASGPTNSIRGSAYLSGERNAIVVDIGGTTTDVGVITNGYPRQASGSVEIAGVSTNFRIPDLITLGLGGGSLVTLSCANPGGKPRPNVGPESVGYELATKALVFGGDTLTATDIAVAKGTVVVGDAARVNHLNRAMVDEVMNSIHDRLNDAIELMKTSAAPCPVVLVGGGSLLVNEPLSGASQSIIPEYAAVANAIGAAIGQIGGETDSVVSFMRDGRDAVITRFKADACERAVSAGARADTVDVVEIDEIPLAYMPGDSVRLRVKAVGALDIDR